MYFYNLMVFHTLYGGSCTHNEVVQCLLQLTLPSCVIFLAITVIVVVGEKWASGTHGYVHFITQYFLHDCRLNLFT